MMGDGYKGKGTKSAFSGGKDMYYSRGKSLGTGMSGTGGLGGNAMSSKGGSKSGMASKKNKMY